MRSKKQLKKIVADGMMHKARVHIGRYGIRPRVLWVYRHAWDGIPPDPTPAEVIRVKIHPGCQMTDAEIVEALTTAYQSEYAGRSGDSMIFCKSE